MDHRGALGVREPLEERGGGRVATPRRRAGLDVLAGRHQVIGGGRSTGVGVIEIGIVIHIGGEQLGRAVAPGCRAHSHSIVPGGFEVTSSATRLTPSTSLMMREEMRSTRSYGRRAQSAVMASSLVTARMTMG